MKAYYPLPDALSQQDVLSFLHNHTALAHLFWPQPVIGVDQRRTSPTSTIFSIGSATTKEKATITTAADETVCEEQLPFGLRMRVAYRVIDTSVGGNGNGVSESSNRLILPDSRLCLEEERSVTAPRPLSLLLNQKDGPISKTVSLVRALNEFGRNGKDVGLTLASLPAPTADPDDAYELEKSKADW
ncbi:hypothetical protein E8E15_003704 [Penicillium rubens]|jgi:hypothetical protein|nr:uncharacterized protein N7525_002193 [Penicillium rubens]KAF3019917.1 hypothetical protein E8E15_003704 [Penicillium rubens]KAJ5033897.1 hypothetical protein NUH16_005315 [Penicillium rubens]KAJ5844452.1 hypothetical protein N7525_002193 [Penicillium rubens]KZN84615.1 hypothetical protein EN45_087560 [Penicillium chrysogenum]